MSLSLTLLVDSQDASGRLKTEHGFSLLVETAEATLLMDTGASGIFQENLNTLGIAPSRLDFIVLSHGHRDHSGGLAQALDRWPEAEILFHPNASKARWSLYAGLGPRTLGMPESASKALEGARTRPVTTPLRLRETLGLTGPIPCIHGIEERSGPFFQDPEGQARDVFEDELALWIRTPEGLVVVTGCAHAGVVNTLEAALAASGETRVAALVGGLHLAKLGPKRLAFTAEALARLGVRRVLPCHCTGEKAEAHFRTVPGLDHTPLKLGERVQL